MGARAGPRGRRRRGSDGRGVPRRGRLRQAGPPGAGEAPPAPRGAPVRGEDLDRVLAGVSARRLLTDRAGAGCRREIDRKARPGRCGWATARRSGAASPPGSRVRRSNPLIRARGALKRELIAHLRPPARGAPPEGRPPGGASSGGGGQRPPGDPRRADERGRLLCDPQSAWQRGTNANTNGRCACRPSTGATSMRSPSSRWRRSTTRWRPCAAPCTSPAAAFLPGWDARPRLAGSPATRWPGRSPGSTPARPAAPDSSQGPGAARVDRPSRRRSVGTTIPSAPAPGGLRRVRFGPGGSGPPRPGGRGGW